VANKEELRALIRAQILSGRLPRSFQHDVYSGKGDGHPCACCGKPIARTRVQYDVEMSRAEDDTDLALSMHFHCYRAWQDETLRLQREAHLQPDA